MLTMFVYKNLPHRPFATLGNDLGQGYLEKSSTPAER